ncbi:UGSC family (seleno)protein [Microbacterium sediminicola]
MVAAIIDPTRGRVSVAASPHAEAVRRGSLGGLRVGLLGNTKRNAEQILDAVGACLQRRGAGQLVRRTKRQFAMPLPDDLVEELVRECDVVVIGVGDCGSCSASAVADGIALEAVGIPTAVVCTTEFATTSRAMAQLKGANDFPFLLTEHPISNLTAAQISARGEDLADDVANRLVTADSALTGTPA